MYYVVLVCSGIIWQCAFLGSIGVTFVGSSILSAVIITVALQVTEVLAVIFYKENFTPEKGVALVLTLWGFVSYFYGGDLGVFGAVQDWCKSWAILDYWGDVYGSKCQQHWVTRLTEAEAM
ncbi:hypothetical protein Vadar_005191 [Vaccinium darrowii]|uniref:Uncharacterized protein n=1 Tax=Vaccinium darrowii TaxID=229202 RepID=A0ACB7XX92_9ERIC|nr:hypothetical protein Vadar_005191 [Vaccinium darrowii]